MMTLSGTIRAFLAKWYITIAGLSLAAAAGSVAFAAVPPSYTSTSTAVLVQPNLPGNSASANPLLTFDPSLNTTAMILVQALTAPDVAAGLGLVPGRDSYTVKNAGSAAIGSGIDQPFISFSAQSPDPRTSVDAVAGLVNLARQDLADRQSGLHVLRARTIMLQTVVGVTPPKPVWLAGLATAGAVVLLGLVLTVITACACAARTNRRIPPERHERTPLVNGTTILPAPEAQTTHA